MEKTSKIYVAGHKGLVGSAIWQNLQTKGYTNLIGKSHKELDLLDGVAVREFFDREKPEYVFLAAAYVGGIMANNIYRPILSTGICKFSKTSLEKVFGIKLKNSCFWAAPAFIRGMPDNR